MKTSECSRYSKNGDPTLTPASNGVRGWIERSFLSSFSREIRSAALAGSTFKYSSSFRNLSHLMSSGSPDGLFPAACGWLIMLMVVISCPSLYVAMRLLGIGAGAGAGVGAGISASRIQK